MEIKNRQTIKHEFLNILTKSKRPPLKLESDRRSEWYISILQNFLNVKNLQHYSRFTDKGSSIAERVIISVRNLLKKPVFEKGNADWISGLSSITKKYNNTIHHSIKMSPIQTAKKSNEEVVYNNLKDNKRAQRAKFKLGQLVCSVDIKKVFSKGVSTNWSYKLHTITQIIHDTLLSYRIDYSTKRYNENLILPTKLYFDENNRVMKELN